jgi:hypothetical protein
MSRVAAAAISLCCLGLTGTAQAAVSFLSGTTTITSATLSSPVAVASATQTITLKSTTAAYKVYVLSSSTAFKITAPTTGACGIVSTSTVTVAANASCNFNVSYTPTTSAAASATSASKCSCSNASRSSLDRQTLRLSYDIRCDCVSVEVVEILHTVNIRTLIRHGEYADADILGWVLVGLAGDIFDLYLCNGHGGSSSTTPKLPTYIYINSGSCPHNKCTYHGELLCRCG